jgi:hypothetical protein
MNSLVKVPPYSKLNFQGKHFFTQNWCNITLNKEDGFTFKWELPIWYIKLHAWSARQNISWVLSDGNNYIVAKIHNFFSSINLILYLITPYIRMLDPDWLIAVILFTNSGLALWICRIFTSCRCICIRFNLFSWYLQNLICRFYSSPRRL